MALVLERGKNKGEAGSGPLRDACCVGPWFNSTIRIVNLLALFVIVRSDNEDMNIYLRSSKPTAAKGMWKILQRICAFAEQTEMWVCTGQCGRRWQAKRAASRGQA